MASVRSLIEGLRSLFRKERTDAELNDELRAYVDAAVAEKIRRGMSAEQARRAVRLEMGTTDAVKEGVHAVSWEHIVETFWQDIRFALRMLRKSPAFTSIAIITLALGIGANTAIFSVVNALLLQPLPYRDANRLVVVWESQPRLANHNEVSPPDFLDWQAQNHVFEGMTYFGDIPMNLTGGTNPQKVIVELVSINYFDVLGVKPTLGHGFTPANEKPGGGSAVVLSYGLWKERFGGNPDIVGRPIDLNGTAVTVLGVAPPNFDLFIAGGSLTGDHAQLWAPFVFPPAYRDRAKAGRFLTVVARRKPGVSVAEAQAQMSVIASRLAAKYPAEDGGWGVVVVPLREEISGAVRPALLILLGAVGLVLLIACANVASLFLSRTAARKREMAVREALGATGWRIVRQLFAESIVLALFGGVTGVLLAIWGADALLHSIPPKLLNLSAVTIDFRVLAFAATATLLSAVLFGILPSFAAARSGFAASLQEGGRSSLNRRNRAIHAGLVVTELALALILLAGAGLLIESFSRLTGVNPGFNRENLLTFKLSLPARKYKSDASQIAFYRELLDKLAHVPGVRSASMENLPPFSGFALWGVATDVTLPGQESLPPAQKPNTAVRVVGPDYFRTMGIPLIQGRSFSAPELAAERHVVIINDTFARKYFPGANPIGRKITIDMKDTNVPSEIIGIAGDVHGAQLSAAPWPTIYWPYPELAYTSMTIVVRAQRNPLALVPAVREIVRGIDPDEPVSNVATMDHLISDSVARSRFSTLLLSIFAALAIALACIGIYGVMAYATAQRRNEIGIRMALGAQRSDILRLIVGQGARLALLGAGIGVVGGLALARLLASQLYAIAPNDPLTFAAATLLLVSVALTACYVPARRAMRVDPMVALRYE